MIGAGGGPGLRLGGPLVVCGTGGSGIGLSDSKPLSMLPDTGLPRGRERLAATKHLDLLPGKP